ncbi:RES family NAD+ phosphorylase [Enterovirga rhinocerotis]|uniref:RES domain-containing protein n=1 Tax=Enterovirga rhinocerotis TaxID=1339210 RepID=A0A4R7C0D6_9HYPH|nr:RES family NAD+ phosphorylase [Enterovirga rhinocerotis]TDR89937.1 RES domain-containing protein [Enterovirga rhinocerotis]
MVTSKLAWTPAYRIIRTIYPPVDLFEDIADPADWELLAEAEAKLNPRIRDEIGNLALVPPARRISGPTASIVMGAFTHVSPDRDSRFSDGSYGVWYCGDSLEVALAETAYHFQLFMRRTAEPPADADFRVLTCEVGAAIVDAPADCLADTDWQPGQRFGRAMRANGTDGIRYPSLRYPEGKAAAIFWPDCLTLPITQNQQLRYRWNGTRMTHYLPHGATAWTIWPIAGIT